MRNWRGASTRRMNGSCSVPGSASVISPPRASCAPISPAARRSPRPPPPPPANPSPAPATKVQAQLGMTHGCAFDIQAVCSGFIYGLAVADNFIKAGQARSALVIGAETFSRILDWNDRGTCVLFGDGAGAVVLRAAPATGPGDRGILSTHLHSD